MASVIPFKHRSKISLSPYQQILYEEKVSRFKKDAPRISRIMELWVRSSPSYLPLEIIRADILSILQPPKCRLKEFNEFIDSIYLQVIAQEHRLDQLRIEFGIQPLFPNNKE